MPAHPDERGRRAPTPAALASLRPVPDGFRILPDPLHGQPLLRVPARPAELRVLLDRSHESAQAGEPTQDYLAVRADPRRLSVAVADGVGSSFLGDVAAQILAAHLTDWLAGATRGGGPFEAALAAFLHGLAGEVAEQVAAWPIPDSVSALVRAALDQQRAYGSEAMFACAVVDLAGGRDAGVTVAWLGDTRLRVIMRDGRQFDYSGQTTDRWSTRLGPRGQVHSQTWPMAEVARVIACTDGLLPELDATVALADGPLGDCLGSLARRPGNDDMALVDIGVGPRALPPGEGATGATLWRRLTDEPPGRHARTTSAGSAWRRFIRAVGPDPVPVTTPPAVTPPVPPPTPRPVPASRPAPEPEPAHTGGPAPTQPSTVASAVASTVEHPAGRHRPLGTAPPADVQWRPSARGPELSWSAVAGADSYSVQVCLEPTFAEPLLYAVRGITFAVPPLPGAVFVRLCCVTGDEPGPWGDTHDLSAPPTGDDPTVLADAP